MLVEVGPAGGAGSVLLGRQAAPGAPHPANCSVRGPAGGVLAQPVVSSPAR